MLTRRFVAKFALFSNYLRSFTISQNVGDMENSTKEVQNSESYELEKGISSKNFAKYSNEEVAKILGAMNGKSVHELQEYDISKTRAQKISVWKSRNGPFRDLDDILFIDGFGVKAVEKFYKSLIHGSSKVEAKKLKPKITPFIYPTLNADEQKAINSCVAIRIGVGSVTWSRLEIPPEDVIIPCELTHWEHHEIIEKKLHLNDLVQRCLYIEHKIPNADVYLFENPQTAQISSNPGSVDQQNINIQKSQIQAVLSYAMHARRKDQLLDSNTSDHGKSQKLSSANKKNVVYLRRFVAARLFNHLVGTEKISSEETIMHLMRTHYNLENDDQCEHDHSYDDTENSSFLTNNIRTNVQFPMTFRTMFQRAQRYHREFLGQALLLNLAFIRLILVQDPKSLSIFPRNKESDVSNV